MRAILSAAMLLAIPTAALADTGPLYVVPGKAGVPVMINGRDASYAVVEGDWGLARSVHVQPTVYGGWGRYHGPEAGHYYPSAGRQPGYGRLEIEPPANRALPPPPESYHRSWSAQSAPPAPQPYYDVPAYPPPVIEAPGPKPVPQSYRPNGFRPDLKK